MIARAVVRIGVCCERDQARNLTRFYVRDMMAIKAALGGHVGTVRQEVRKVMRLAAKRPFPGPVIVHAHRRMRPQ